MFIKAIAVEPHSEGMSQKTILFNLDNILSIEKSSSKYCTIRTAPTLCEVVEIDSMEFIGCNDIFDAMKA